MHQDDNAEEKPDTGPTADPKIDPINPGNPAKADSSGTAGAVPPEAPPLELTAEAKAAAEEPGSPLPRFWDAMKRLPRYARVAAALVADPAVPKRSKVALGVGGLYAVSPVDLVPGVIPVAGQLDDLYVLLRALRQALHSAPPDVSARHLHAVDLTMANVESDIKSMEETTVWLVKKGFNAGTRAATSGVQAAKEGAGAGRRIASDGIRRARNLFGNRERPTS
ncbi:MAG TPA: DUF1232 domain-containing protein [Thermomicrobiales bacterium]|jgi:uncharacterized membrane protein YkvA (DUF1232 family)|nr:DUF1232 domain-containing protein [Thermomicrobiales bacterium]